MSLIEKACRIARDQNMKVAIDLASYNVVESSLADFKEIIGKYADIIFANEEEAKAYTGKGPEEALEAISGECEIAVVKVGSEGSWIRRGSEIIKIGTPEVNLKDTTGAGDLYAAGFLYGYACNCNLEICGQYGSLVAGKVIEILGARMDDSRWDEIKELIQEIV
jgi:sugar/nucleoside kinase (ribokinase family)